MAAQNSGSGSSAKPKTQKKAPQRKAPSTTSSRPGQARSVAERAVDLPVGAVLEVSDRVADLVEPFSGRTAAERQFKSYGSQLRRTVKRTERRGATARRKATTEARKTRNDVERRVRRTVDEQTSRAQTLVDQVGNQLAALR